MSIKTNFEFPRGEDPGDVIKQGQRLAQDLSKNFKALSKKIINIQTSIRNSLPSNFIDLSYSLDTGTGAAVSQNHNLGVVPVGWYVIDYTGAIGSSFIRNSWSTTALSLSGYSNLGGTAVIKVRVFI